MRRYHSSRQSQQQITPLNNAQEQLGTNPAMEGQRQVVFLSSNNADASATVAAIATQLGFAPVELGWLNQGGTALHVLGGRPGGLLFQNLVKLG